MEEMPSQITPVQRLKIAILPLALPCSGLVTPFRGNFNYWQVSQQEAEQILLRRRHSSEKGITI
jgi:hypothetical protein